MNINQDFFKLPIEYISDKRILPDVLVQDLEMLDSLPESTELPIYQKICHVTTELGQRVLKRFAKHYTTDVVFIQDMQTLLNLYKPSNIDDESSNINVWSMWMEHIKDKDFKTRYSFVDWDWLQWLNNSELFLFVLAMYNIASPLISLLLPFMMLIIPFCILYIQGIEISFERYFEILFEISEGNAVSRLFTNFGSCKMEERIYLIVSACVYLFSFYQNFVLCLKFCRNIQKINDEMMKMKQYIIDTLEKMEKMLQITNSIQSFNLFHHDLQKNYKSLVNLLPMFIGITNFNCNHSKVNELGVMLKLFYLIREDSEIVQTLMYSFEFNGFHEILIGLSKQINLQQLNPCTINKKKNKKSVMKSLFYAGLINNPIDDIVKNTVKFDKHFILTGPNASGKTTLLKAILLNSIFSQQFGYGCYSTYTCKPYDYFHCYLNICDNSSRDSLFQSESKKCQSIINAIDKGPTGERHFCAFDELFSGTNPKEAVNCGFGFLSYLCKKKKCAMFLLTTHYLDLCKKLKNENNTTIYKMVVDKQTDGIKYKYLIQKGYNTVDGGIDVLKQLKFPEEIVKLIENQ